MINAKITSMPKGPRSLSDYVYFEAVSDKPITEAQAGEEQIKLGFHPGGYGLYQFTTWAAIDAPGKFKARWNCCGSCD